MHCVCILIMFYIYLSNVHLFAITLRSHILLANNSSKRIIGGIPANIKDYPFTACLVLKNAYYDNFRGGAVIISKRWAITAAHCMQYISNVQISKKHAFVRSNSAFWKQGYIDHLITGKYVHKKFDLEALDYDIALIHVRNPFEGNCEKPILIPRENYKYKVNSVATVLGWGTTTPKTVDYFYVDQLRVVNISLINFDTCKNIPRDPDIKVTDRMVCAGAPGKDSCVYDSGGPLIQNNVLIGLVSWGPPKCADPIEPGVYTKMSKFNGWINGFIHHHYSSK